MQLTRSLPPSLTGRFLNTHTHTHTHTHTQDPQSTEADTEGVYDLLERNKSTEELREQGVSMKPDLE